MAIRLKRRFSALSFGPPPNDAVLLLDSNDWAGVSITPDQGTATGNLDQHLAGGPFDANLFSNPAELDAYRWYLLFNSGSGNPLPVSNYGGAYFENVIDRAGNGKRVLSFAVSSDVPQTSDEHIRLADYQSAGVAGVGGRVEPVFYQREWIKFDANTLARAQRVGQTDFFQTFWEMKCEPDFRFRVRLQYNGTKLYWRAHDDVLTSATPIHSGSNTTVDVVLAADSSEDGWHKFEVFIDRPNGVWRAAIDGVDIINLNLGPGTGLFGASGNAMNFPMFMQLHSAGAVPFSGDGPMKLMTVGLELWDKPPADAWTVPEPGGGGSGEGSLWVDSLAWNDAAAWEE